MKILFKNTTKYDKENCNNFIIFHNNKYGKKELIKSLIILIAVIYILIFNLIYRNWYFIILMILASVLLYFVNKYKIEKKKKKKRGKQNKEYTFFFYDRYIKIKHKRQYERMIYFDIKKIFETDKNFFLYTDENHSLILDKEGFEIGTQKEFAEFIRRKCPFKYRGEKKK